MTRLGSVLNGDKGGAGWGYEGRRRGELWSGSVKVMAVQSKGRGWEGWGRLKHNLRGKEGKTIVVWRVLGR